MSFLYSFNIILLSSLSLLHLLDVFQNSCSQIAAPTDHKSTQIKQQ